MNPIIRVRGLSKQYRIGARRARYGSLRDSLVAAVSAPLNALRRRRAEHPSIWALKDVSFDVMPGEVVGIIGRNGAGKSTLLKILTRITEPTEGSADLYGRVASLLEVGTGFHPELTGRENIFLNGAILGMRRAEIARKLDQIITFAGVGQLIDSPVKHFSSGMYVRLAFAVAAHLEPEILLVDEVLAVGDAEFQRRCLGKMREVATAGRTVLFVSHNMAAVQALCVRALQLEAGHVRRTGDAKTVASEYLSMSNEDSSAKEWGDDTAPGNEELRLDGISVHNGEQLGRSVFQSRDDIFVDMRFTVRRLHSALCVGFDLLGVQGETVFRSYQTDMPPGKWPNAKIGHNCWRCAIPRGLLNGGIYLLQPRIGLHSLAWIVNLDAGIQFEVVLDHGVSPFWSNLDSRSRPGVIAPILNWKEIG